MPRRIVMKAVSRYPSVFFATWRFFYCCIHGHFISIDLSRIVCVAFLVSWRSLVFTYSSGLLGVLLGCLDSGLCISFWPRTYMHCSPTTLFIYAMTSHISFVLHKIASVFSVV
ncbi:hypothetical protein BDW74DRAFT_44274 [Aspergillus multicolor]|uniref:uncharacterized protein n=1 Tax=Aspergillus multicolor TaxID=41759 RepID=UPI003CCCD031